MMTRLRPNRPTRLSLQTLESRDVPAGSLQVDSSEYAADRVIVKFQTDKVPTSPLARSVDGIGWGMYTVTLRPNVTVDRALKHFRAQAGIEFAEPDYTVRVQLAPNDPRYTDGTLWGMNNTGQSGGTADADIDAPEAWDVSTGSGNFVVAVIDTGVNYNHPDLAANMWRNPGEDGKTAGVDDDGNGIVDDIFGADFANNDGNPMDDDGHGTHVAGTIAAVGNNGTGVVGVNWRAKVMAIKFLGPFGGSTSNAVKSLNYAVAKGAKISNNSWGGGGFSSSLDTAITNARNAGHIFVAAAGNNGSNNDSSPFYPASHTQDNVVSVASSTRTDGLSSFSNYGATSVDLAAPGSSIFSTYNGGYATLSGTSMAAPHVAGALALKWDSQPGLTYLQVIESIKNTVDVKPAFQGKMVTNGRLNLNAAMHYGADTAGPKINSHSFSGTGGAISALRVTFNEAMKAATFTTADVNFTGPGGGITVTNVTPVSGSQTQFDITFPSQSAPGNYTMVIGPNVTDLADNPMNQDGDGTNGEATQDQYTATHNIPVPDTSGPKVTAHAFSGTGNAIDKARFTFDESINTSTFTTADVSFTGPAGAITVSNVVVVSGTNNTQFDVTFASQSALGTYTMVIGPNINDTAGNPMNQDGDGTNGEATEDQYTATTTLADTTGPRVTAHAFSGTGNAIDKARFTFNEAIDTATFTTGDVSFTGPGGAIAVSNVAVVSGSGNTQFDVTFANQTALGTYTMVIGPNIADTSNNLMDQDQDGIKGEATDDQYTATTTLSDVTGPRVTAHAFSGPSGAINAARFTFNEAINTSTFTTADVSFTGPGGAISVSNVAVVSGSGNTQFDVTFASQTAPGTYTMVIGPNIADTDGNLMDQDQDGTKGESPDDQYTATTTLTDITGPRVTAHAFSGSGSAISSARFTFNEAIDSASFTTADVSFTGPGGAIGVTGVAAVSGSGNTQFDVTFASQSSAGSYNMVIGPNIADAATNLMDQDQDGINGEATDDQYTATTTITAGQTFSSTNVPQPIVFGASSTLTVGPSLTINDINVTLNVTHTAVGQLTVILTAPNGTQITLVANRGGTGDNFTNTVFDDEATTPIGSGVAPFTGSFKPEQALSAFDGLNAQGTWTLLIIDNNPRSDTGTLNGWSLTIS